MKKTWAVNKVSLLWHFMVAVTPLPVFDFVPQSSRKNGNRAISYFSMKTYTCIVVAIY